MQQGLAWFRFVTMLSSCTDILRCVADLQEDLASAALAAQAVAALREEGPALGRSLVDRIQGSRVHHLKELRPGSKGRSEIRVLFAFDPTRSALLLLGGDKAGNWQRWYRQNIPLAEQLLPGLHDRARGVNDA